MPVELELGATDDPRALVLGDPEALAATEAHLEAMAAAFGRTADGLDHIRVGSWRGTAGDAFRSRFPQAAQQWTQAHDAFGNAATSWRSYRDVVGRAQASAAEAIARYRAGVAASQQAVAQRNAAIDRYDTQVRAADAGAGQVPAALPAFVDPGPAQLAAARSVLAQARGERDEVAGRAAVAMRAAAAVAPDPPTGWDGFVADAGDGLRAGLDDVGRLLGGAAEGGEDLLRSARALNPTDPWNLAHPAHYVDAVSTTVAGLATTAVHPVRLVSDIVGNGWGSDPVAAAGRLIPTLVGAVVSDGTAAGVRAAAGVVERAAVDGAAVDGAAVDGAAVEPGVVGRAGTVPGDGRRAAMPAPDERVGGEPVGGPVELGSPAPAGLQHVAHISVAAAPADSPVARLDEAAVERTARPPARPAWRDAVPPDHGDPTGPVRRQPTGSPLVQFREPHLARAAAASVDEQVARELAHLAMHRSIIGGLGLDIPYVPLHPGLGIVEPVTPPPVIFRAPPAGVADPARPAAPLLDGSGRVIVPAGFVDAAAFDRFGAVLYRGLSQAGHPDTTALLLGSSVTGVKYATGVPFDVGRVSDLDLALVDGDLFTTAKNLGIPVRRSPPPRTRPLETQDLRLLGLLPVARRLSTIAGRQVSFMVYATAEEARGRGPSIEVRHP